MKKNPPSLPADATPNMPDPLDYKPEDDIYNKGKREANINPDDNTVILNSHEKITGMNEKDFTEDMSGSDLDIPGSELDDRDEEIGEEDEENNYYSLGGDNHLDLEEPGD
jgi:hypothetical protein